ncbi:MAG: penicillin-binding transpeptidase domain-containing protein [Bacteroidota bacterium]|nr:penicillin-binding transpeptidase domain-containing protein [Candidatus Kapabacteria bacterium]MDW8219458.1 penicillin-binding transpeptidase domain-containing protein [Bacteroidota bacterium]
MTTPHVQDSKTALYDDEHITRRMNSKVKYVFLAFLAGFSIIAVKLFVIQIIWAEYYQDIARRQYESKIELPAERGKVFDRKYRLVATTVEKLSLAVDPKMLKDTLGILRTLAVITGEPIERYIAKIRGARSRFVWLERAIDVPSAALMKALDTLEDSGLIKVREPRRSFAYGSLAAQILGFTNAEGKGASGIELGWDSVLSGRNGYMFLQRDGRGRKRPVPEAPMLAPQAGYSLVLTLDMDMQTIVESELRQGVEYAEAVSGSAIVLQPATGAILAMASYPSFNPNDLFGATPELTRNSCFTDTYEPGSTFKAITAAALLEEHKVSPGDIVVGAEKISGRDGVVVVRDEHPVGRVTFAQALEKSSNVVIATLAQRLSTPKFYKYTRDFGFGIFTGIDVPGEVRGTVKKPAEFDYTTKMYMAHGYELSVTVLQLANAYATIANGGVMMKPYLVQRIIDAERKDVQVFEPQRVRRVISEATATTLTHILCGVVERGTGMSARVPGLAIAGKTGTSQQIIGGKYSKRDYNASFAGYFPADKPEVVIVVRIDKPRKGYYGADVAAPVFQRIAQKFVSSGLVSTGSRGMLASEQAADTSKGKVLPSKTPSGIAQRQGTLVEVPDFRGLLWNDALDVAQHVGLKIAMPNAYAKTGEIVISGQRVNAGTLVKVGTVIAVDVLQPDFLSEKVSAATIPNVRGMSVRRALTLLHAAGIKTKVIGHGGVVVRQEFRGGKEPLCILDCVRE